MQIKLLRIPTASPEQLDLGTHRIHSETAVTKLLKTSVTSQRTSELPTCPVWKINTLSYPLFVTLQSMYPMWSTLQAWSHTCISSAASPQQKDSAGSESLPPPHGLRLHSLKRDVRESSQLSPLLPCLRFVNESERMKRGRTAPGWQTWWD